MEHNGYARWRVKMRTRRRVWERDVDDNRTLLSTQVVDESFNIVAPKGDLGKALLNVHFAENTSWKYGDFELLDSGAKFEILELVEEPIKTIIQYDDEYRGRM